MNNANLDSDYCSVILFDSGTGHTYKENLNKIFEGKSWGAQETLISVVSYNYQF